MATKEIRATVHVGGQDRTLDFEDACDLVERYVKREKEGCEYQVNEINNEMWVQSFWSEVLGGCKPPTHQEWTKPLFKLDSARSAYRGGNIGLAKDKIKQAVDAYNEVHRKWIAYSDGIEKGATRSITIMEITIDVLSSAAAGGVGGGGTLTKLAASGTMKAYSETCKQTGKVAYGLQDGFDIVKLATNVGESVATSFITGVMAKKFLGILAPRLSATWKIDRELARELSKGGSRAQKFLCDYFSDFGFDIVKDGIKNAVRKARQRKTLSVAEFMSLVADEMVHEISISNVAKHSLKAFSKQYFGDNVRHLRHNYGLRGPIH